MQIIGRIRGVLLLLCLPPLTFVFSAATLAAVLLLRVSQRRAAFFPRTWSRIVTAIAGVRVRVEGAGNVEPDRPYIFAANHQSQFDIFALQGYFPFDFRWLAKQELFRIPVFGRAMLRSGHIPVDRGNRRKAARSLEAAAGRIRSGTSVIIFPEGTRSVDGRLGEFKAGAMVLAVKAGVPVVPVAICGSRDILPKGALVSRSGQVVIRIGRPVATESVTLKEKGELAARLHDEVAALLAQGI